MIALMLLAFTPYAAPPDSPIYLIAHRGGVVDAQHVENTLPSLEAAIQQGYWMAELDVRESKDGELIVQHDGNFLRNYGVRKPVEELTWAEIQTLHSRIDGKPPQRLEDFAAACRGKIRVMIDSKEEGNHPGFYENMERILRENDLLESAFFIGSAGENAHFKGKARVAAGCQELQAAVAAGEDVAARYFLFGHGNELDAAALDCAKALNVPVVASVNTFHYLTLKPQAGPEADIQRLRAAGVVYFQIDSVYAKYFE